MWIIFILLVLKELFYLIVIIYSEGFIHWEYFYLHLYRINNKSDGSN